MCLRKSANADFTSQNSRWGVFYHRKDWKAAPPKKVRKFLTNLPPLFAEPAPIEICHLAYNYILQKSPTANFPGLIDELQKRGIEQFENYGALPAQKRFRQRLAAKIVKLLKQNFPEFLQNDLWQLTRIPGFWVDEQKRPSLWYPSNLKREALLIPYRTQNGLIKSMQIRFPGDGERQHFYQWLSVGKMPGVKTKPTLHFSYWKKNFSGKNKSNSMGNDEIAQSKLEKKIESKTGETLLITEGALKADVINNLLKTKRLLGRKVSVIGNGGITTAHDEIVSFAGDKNIWLGFNLSDETNSHVRGEISKLIRKLEDDFIKPKEIKILRWTGAVSSLDAALLLDLPISAISTEDWFNLQTGTTN